jgi:hypothetical protein
LSNPGPACARVWGGFLRLGGAGAQVLPGEDSGAVAGWLSEARRGGTCTVPVRRWNRTPSVVARLPGELLKGDTASYQRQSGGGNFCRALAAAVETIASQQRVSKSIPERASRETKLLLKSGS